MQMNLFHTDFKNPFKVDIAYKPYMGSNTDQHVKRVLMEIADTHDNPILAYSGGMDSGFVLRCLADLRKEGFDKIDVYYGTFYSSNKRTVKDKERAFNFAHRLGIEVKNIDLHIDKSVIDESIDLAEKYRFSSPVSIVQEVWRRRIDATVIKADPCLGGTSLGKGQVVVNRYRTINHKFIDLLDDTNTVEIYHWDIDIFSSLITNFYVHRKTIDMEPLQRQITRDIFANPFNPFNFNASFFKWMIYLERYPDMMEIFFKFPTFVLDTENKEMVSLYELCESFLEEEYSGYIHYNGIPMIGPEARRIILND